jgi:hypothetical protein
MLISDLAAELEEDPTPARKTEGQRCWSCPAEATVEVLDAIDNSRGFYCKRCGRAKLRVLRLQERKVAP